MNRRQLEGYRAEYEFRQLLTNIRDYFQRGPNLDRKLLMALHASVQRLIDEVAETRGLKESVVKGFDLTTAKIAELKALLDGIVPGQAVDEENAAAIAKAVDELDQVNEGLKVAIPADAPPVPPPTAEELVARGITTPPTHDSAGNPIEPPKP